MASSGEADGRRIYNALPRNETPTVSKSTSSSHQTIEQQQETQVTPHEELTKSRGRKTFTKSSRVKYDERAGVLSSRKSPRKLSMSTSFSNFFKSPTPKKKCTPKTHSELNHIKVKSSLRRRLTLNSLSVVSKKLR